MVLTAFFAELHQPLIWNESRRSAADRFSQFSVVTVLYCNDGIKKSYIAITTHLLVLLNQ